MKGIRKRGDSYHFTVTSNYIRKYKTYKLSEEDKKLKPKQLTELIQQEYYKFKNQVLLGEYHEDAKLTFSEFVEIWETKFAVNELSLSTIGNHQYKLKNHILPVLGEKEITKINHLQLLDLLANLSRKDGKDDELSLHSKQDIFRTLKSIFKYAHKWKVIKFNPMLDIPKPKVGNSIDEDLEVYTEQEISQILKFLEYEPFRWRVIFILAVSGGLRRGEILGLEWSKIDFEKRSISITKSIVLTKSGPKIKSTKTRSAKRIVTLPDSVMDELKNYKEYWDSFKDSCGELWIENQYQWLFCQENGKHLYPSTPSNWWNDFARKKGFRYIRFHDLRHTSASLLIAKGIHPKVISERLGHADISITMNNYGHVIQSANREAADKFQNLFKGPN